VRSDRWTVRLSDTAEADYDEILRWTARRFGVVQAASCGNLIAAVLARLERGPNIAAVQRRDEIGAGLHTLHVGRRGRHGTFDAFDEFTLQVGEVVAVRRRLVGFVGVLGEEQRAFLAVMQCQKILPLRVGCFRDTRRQCMRERGGFLPRGAGAAAPADHTAQPLAATKPKRGSHGCLAMSVSGWIRQQEGERK
jgi:plasmid stabilization system protein ParE